MKTIISSAYDGKKRTCVEKTCEFCQKSFLAPMCRKARFCSPECKHKGLQKKVTLICAKCGGVFERSPNKLRNSRSQIYFCSRECKDEAQRHGGIEEIHPDHYNGVKEYRTKALRIHGAKCRRCGYEKHEVMLDVHHINGDHSDNGIENLEVLCVWCHALKTRNVSEHDREAA